jgi:hypothetical protein
VQATVLAVPEHALIGAVRDVVRPLVYCDRGYDRFALEASLLV